MNRYELGTCQHCGDGVLKTSLQQCPFIDHPVCTACYGEAKQVMDVCRYTPKAERAQRARARR